MTTTACPGFFAAAPMGRREVLRAGSLAVLGLGLPQLLHADKASPRRTAKSCILLFMWGGPAHQDTWDLKPDAPSEYRGEITPIAAVSTRWPRAGPARAFANPCRAWRG